MTHRTRSFRSSFAFPVGVAALIDAAHANGKPEVSDPEGTLETVPLAVTVQSTGEMNGSGVLANWLNPAIHPRQL